MNFSWKYTRFLARPTWTNKTRRYLNHNGLIQRETRSDKEQVSFVFALFYHTSHEYI